MDIHHFVGKKSHAQSSWVYSQKGYDFMVNKKTSPENLAVREPGMPVLEPYNKLCPAWWTHNGWVEEKEIEHG